MHILDQIVAHKHDAVASARKRVPETELIDAAEARSSSRSLHRALAAEGPRRINIVAEIKRAWVAQKHFKDGHWNYDNGLKLIHHLGTNKFAVSERTVIAQKP